MVEKIYRAALAEHKELKELPEAELRTVIRGALEEIDRLERAANPREVKSAMTPEIAENLSALWVFSGPGTYDSAKKNDRYQTYPWAEWMDRDRLSYAGWLARISAELVAEGENPRGPIGEADKRKAEARKAIGEHGPIIIYNGTAEENEVARSVPKREGIIVPEEKVVVAGGGIAKTVDQIKTFALPENLHRPGGEIGLVSHAPHLMRVLHMLKRYEPLPKDMKVRLFPIASPIEGKEEYVTLEVKGLLYYIYLSAEHDADKETYPHIIHREEE